MSSEDLNDLPPPPSSFYLSSPTPAINRVELLGQRTGNPIASNIVSPMASTYSLPPFASFIHQNFSNVSVTRGTNPEIAAVSSVGASAFAADLARFGISGMTSFTAMGMGMGIAPLPEGEDDGTWNVAGTRGSLINVANYPYGSYRPPSFSNYSTTSVDSTLVDLELDDAVPQDFDLSRAPSPTVLDDEEFESNVRRSFEEGWHIEFDSESPEEKKARLEMELRRFEVEQMLIRDAWLDYNLAVIGF